MILGEFRRAAHVDDRVESCGAEMGEIGEGKGHCAGVGEFAGKVKADAQRDGNGDVNGQSMAVDAGRASSGA
ncbi:hypothetical protein MACH21_27340 [Roseicyclus marinus]|uniref:Uncharacterized protein n=1 Tax=Roseicyclus marinus TaxID=2161673 RepID=A0AA48HA14_9RHOB|nr:hypothetical protein MACH21_27340 [Roseicyclus marinus]